MTATDERPALYGFFHEKLFMSAREAADVRGRMVEFAARWNYRLAKVFIDRPDQAPAGFNALREAVLQDRAAVVVPTVDHLKPYGDVHALVEELKAPSGHHVMRSEPEDH
jgi:hypothetical protein